MNILITGSNGFIGKSLIKYLKNHTDHVIYTFSKNNYISELENIIKKIDIVFHFAGINKSENKIYFEKINVNLTQKLCDLISKNSKTILFYASSTQVILDNDYGKSKKKGEQICLNLEKQSNNKVYILRLPGIFGDGCKPNYNSVVSTFCYNTVNKKNLRIIDPNKEIDLLFIEDLCGQLNQLINKVESSKFIKLKDVHKISIKDLAIIISNFRNYHYKKNSFEPKNNLEKNLYKTYISFT